LEDFFQTLCLYVPHFGAFSLIRSAPQRNAATLRKVFAPLSVSHVIAIDSCSLLYLGVSLSFLLFLNFIAINDCLFNNENNYSTWACWISNNYNHFGATRLVAELSINPARPNKAK